MRYMGKRHWFEKILDESTKKVINEIDSKIKKLINDELREKERDFFKDNDLVILVKDGKTYIYEHGKAIGWVRSVTFEHGIDVVSTIEYEKVVR